MTWKATEAIERIEAFLDAKSEMAGIDPETIHSCHGSKGRADLKVSDILTLIDAAKA